MQSLEDRYWQHVEKTETCWMWTGPHSKYGQIADGLGGRPSVHRLAYEFEYGPIPSGMQVDHVCRVKLCVNPSHLRLATPKQNQENKPNSGYVNSKSGVRGVHWDKVRDQWCVRVGHYGRNYFGGRFATLEDAEVAAIRLRRELFTHNVDDRAA